MPATLWLTLALTLLLLALVGLDSDGLLTLGAASALVLLLLNALVPLPAGGQILLALVLVGAGYAALRRWGGRSREQPIPPAANAGSAEVIESFDAGGQGRVLWQGQSWAALNLAPERSLHPGSRVSVLGQEGTRLQVLPEGDDEPGSALLSRRT